jgi:hypothetical protein
MAVTLAAGNTYTATTASPGTAVHTVTTAGTFTFHIDLTTMAAGDVVELRIYSKVLTGSTPRVVYYQQYRNAQATDNAVQISVPISNDLVEANALQFYVYQSVNRSLPWKVLQYV